jgi:hypothetical protein
MEVKVPAACPAGRFRPAGGAVAIAFTTDAGAPAQARRAGRAAAGPPEVSSAPHLPEQHDAFAFGAFSPPQQLAQSSPQHK